MAERKYVKARNPGRVRGNWQQHLQHGIYTMPEIFPEAYQDGKLRSNYGIEIAPGEFQRVPYKRESVKPGQNTFESQGTGRFGGSTTHPKEQRIWYDPKTGRGYTREQFNEERAGHMVSTEGGYQGGPRYYYDFDTIFEHQLKKKGIDYNENEWHSFLDNQSGTEIASAGDLSGLLASNPNQRTMDQILADWDSAYKTHESWDWQNPAARAAWDDYQSLKEKNAAANEAKSRAWSASGYMDDNLNWQYRLPTPTYTYEGEDAAYAAYDKAIRGGSYKDIAGYDEINRGGLEAYDNISKFEAEYNAMVDSWSNFYQTEDEPIGDTMGEIEISKNIPPGKGGSPGQPYQPPKEDPKNPYVPAPGKKLAEGHPYVSDDSDLPYNWDGSGDWKDDDELQKKIDSLIGPSGGFEAQLPTRLQDNLRRQKKAANIAQESWTIGRPSSNRQTRIPTLTEGGLDNPNRQRQTFRIT